MRNTLSIATVLLVHALTLRAGVAVDASIAFGDIEAKKLVPLDGEGALVTPTFKFFDHDRLVGFLAGAPTTGKPLKLALHVLPAGLPNRPLREELTKLDLDASRVPRTVIIYTMDDRCPPCEHIIKNVLNQLQGLGWEQAQVLIVNIVLSASK